MHETMSRIAVLVVLIVTMLAGAAWAAGGKVRVEFPGRKLAAERKGKRVDYMHLKPGENLTIRATGPVRINVRVCRVLVRGEALPPATSLIVARDDGKVSRVALDLKTGKKAPRPFDRKLGLTLRATFQIDAGEGDHIYVVTTDTAAGSGLAVRVTKGKKKKKNRFVFVEPGTTKPASVEPATTPVAAAPTPKPAEPAPKPAEPEPELPSWAYPTKPKPSPETGDEVIDVNPPPTPPPTVVREDPGINNAVFWTAASAGVVAALASGGMRVWYRQEEATYDDKSSKGASEHEIREHRDRMVMLERMYIGFAVAAGAAGLTAGIVAIFTDWGGEDEAATKTAVAPMLAPDGGGVSLRLEF